MNLVTQTVLDCHGQVTHRLRLRMDGTVEIIDAHRNRAIVDPLQRICLTAGARIAPHVMDIAVSMGTLGLR